MKFDADKLKYYLLLWFPAIALAVGNIFFIGNYNDNILYLVIWSIVVAIIFEVLAIILYSLCFFTINEIFSKDKKNIEINDFLGSKELAATILVVAAVYLWLQVSHQNDQIELKDCVDELYATEAKEYSKPSEIIDQCKNLPEDDFDRPGYYD